MNVEDRQIQQFIAELENLKPVIVSTYDRQKAQLDRWNARMNPQGVDYSCGVRR